MRMLRNGLCARLTILGLCVAAAGHAGLAAGEEPATVKLTGVSALLGNKRALMLIQSSSGPTGTAAARQSCVLGEGESQGPVKVLSIDAAAGRVRILNAGKEMDLTLTRDGLELPAPAAAPVPAPRQLPEVARPVPVAASESPGAFVPRPEPAEPSAPVIIGRNARRENPPRFRSELIAPARVPAPSSAWPPERIARTSRPAPSQDLPPTILSTPQPTPQPVSSPPLLQVPARQELPQPFQPPAYVPLESQYRGWSGSSSSAGASSAAGGAAPKFQRPVVVPPPSPPSQ